MNGLRLLAPVCFAISIAQPTFAQPLPEGMYHTIQHKATGRFVDAYGNEHDSRAVLRHVQFNDTQKWRFTLVPGEVDLYTLQQVSNSRFLDAYEDDDDDRDYGVVTRPAQNNETQQWRLVSLGEDTYRVQQQSTERFLEAYDRDLDDFALITRDSGNDDRQKWVIKPVELNGTYFIQHQASGRYVDAYESDDNDYSMVHRPHQKNLTQRWVFAPLGNNTYTIRQKSTGRFADAYTDDLDDHDFGMVTRPQQNNNSQKWIVSPLGNNTFSIRQGGTGRFVDAYAGENNDFALVTRAAQNDGSQVWKITPEIQGTYTVRQKSSARYLDAHTNDDGGNDYRLFTDGGDDDHTQHWLFTPLGEDTYTIQQWHKARFMDAYTNNGNDHELVTRPPQFDDTQRWRVTYLGGDDYRIQQKGNARFIDAHEEGDRRVVTRNRQDNDTQEWTLRRASVPKPDVAYGSPNYVTGQGHPSVSGAIDEIVTEHLRLSRIPGATVAVSENGRLVFAKGYGYENVNTKKPMQPTSRTRIGSVSKIITALGFMRLSEQTPGLSPESKVYGPNGVLNHPSYTAAIQDHQTQHEDPSPQDWFLGLRVNHLLSHTSGNKRGFGESSVPEAANCEEVSCKYRKIVQHNLRHSTLLGEPGSVGDYENVNLGTVGLVISEVSGQEYRDYILSSILIPLGLSGIVHENGQTDALDSEPHLLTHDGTSTSVYDAGPSTTGLAAGGWMASAQQMVRLMAATDKLSNQPDILSSASIDVMETAPYPNAAGSVRALGWGRSCQNGASTSSCRMDHNGALTGGRAYIAKYKDQFKLQEQDVGGINVAVLFNVRKAAGHKGLAEEIAKLVGSSNIPTSYDLFLD